MVFHFFFRVARNRAAAQKCSPLAMAIALDIRKGISHETSTFIEFPVIEIASAIGWNSGVVKYQLKQLEWTAGSIHVHFSYFISSFQFIFRTKILSIHSFNIENGSSRRSNISVEFSDLGFRVSAPGDLSAIELDATLDMLYSRVKEQELNQTNQVRFFLHLHFIGSKLTVIF